MSDQKSPESRAISAAKIMTALAVIVVAPLVIGLVAVAVTSGRMAVWIQASLVFFQTMGLLAASFVLVFALVYAFHMLARRRDK